MRTDRFHPIPHFRRRALGPAAAGLVLISLASGTAAQTPAENTATVRAAFDAWKAGTGGPYDLLLDEARWTIEGNSAASKAYPSKQAFISEVIRPFNARMSVGLKPAIRSITAEADRVAILFDALGTARDGRPYANTYAWFFEMRQGRVVKANAFFDAIAFDDLWTRVTPRID